MELPYFPLGIFGDVRDGRSFYGGWYSYFLESMGEESLYQANVDPRLAIRFLLLPTFGSPILVRVNRIKAGGLLIGKQNDGFGGSAPGPNTSRVERDLLPVQFKDIETTFRQLRFWDIPTNSKVLGTDGSQWILEASESRKYHVVHRWCPNHYSPGDKQFVRFCESLVNLTGFETDALS